MRRTQRSIGSQLLTGLLALVAGFSAWLVIPWMQGMTDGTAMPAEGWVDGLVPLVAAVLALTCAVRFAPPEHRWQPQGLCCRSSPSSPCGR